MVRRRIEERKSSTPIGDKITYYVINGIWFLGMVGVVWIATGGEL